MLPNLPIFLYLQNSSTNSLCYSKRTNNDIGWEILLLDLTTVHIYTGAYNEGGSFFFIFLGLDMSAAVGDFSRSRSNTTVLFCVVSLSSVSQVSLSMSDSRLNGSEVALRLLLVLALAITFMFNNLVTVSGPRIHLFPVYHLIIPKLCPSAQKAQLFQILCPHIRRTPTWV